MLTIVFWLWKDPLCRNQYTVEHVNRAARMVRRNLTIPHRMVVFSDKKARDAPFDDGLHVYPLWDDWHLLKAPMARWRREYPQCYVRLRAFSDEPMIHEILGERYVSVDLDCVVTGNLDELFSRKEDFLIVRSPDYPSRGPYNGSMWMMDTGCRAEVWEDFSEDAVKAMPENIDFHVTDQGWLYYRLGPNEAGWTEKDGVYLWQSIVNYQGLHSKSLPPDSKICFFNGADKPWHLDWTKKYENI